MPESEVGGGGGGVAPGDGSANSPASGSLPKGTVYLPSSHLLVMEGSPLCPSPQAVLLCKYLLNG